MKYAENLVNLPLPKGQHINRRKERRKYLKSQMDLARRLDKVCMNRQCDKKAFLSWKLDSHHINGRGKDFLGVEHIIILCRVCHNRADVDVEFMINILNFHCCKHYYRWTKAMVELRIKRDHLIYKRGQHDAS